MNRNSVAMDNKIFLSLGYLGQASYDDTKSMTSNNCDFIIKLKAYYIIIVLY